MRTRIESKNSYIRANQGKWCSKCHAKNPKTGWLLKKNGTRSTMCNHCTEYSKRWKKENPSYGREFMARNRLKYLERIRKYSKFYYEANKDKLNEASRLYGRSWYQKVGKPRLQTPERKFKTYVNSSARRGTQFSLSFSEFMEFWQSPCFYCGDPILTIGIDRIDNSIGYTKENCVPCCTMCNWLKRSFPQRAFIEQCKKISIKHAL